MSESSQSDACAGLLGSFDRHFARATELLDVEMGPVLADRLRRDARSAFREIVPTLPLPHGGRSLVRFVAIHGWTLALREALCAADIDSSQCIRICFHGALRYFASQPWYLRMGLRRLAFSGALAPLLSRLEAGRSDLAADDFSVSLVRGRRSRRLLDVRQCPVPDFYQRHGAGELAGLCSFVELAASEALGLGLRVESCLGGGDERCRLCFQARRQTAVPESLRAPGDRWEGKCSIVGITASRGQGADSKFL